MRISSSLPLLLLTGLSSLTSGVMMGTTITTSTSSLLVVRLLLLVPHRSIALKHTYYTRHDERTFIGPLGYPFGFLPTGHYNVTIRDFKINIPNYVHSHDDPRVLVQRNQKLLNNHRNDDETTTQEQKEEKDKSWSEMISESIKGIGFLLKRFKDEADFNSYMTMIQADSTLCIYQEFLDAKADNYDEAFTGWNQDYEIDDDFPNDDVFMGMNDDFGDDDRREREFRRLLSGGTDEQKKDTSNINGDGEVLTSAGEEGIFIDMRFTSRWSPNTANASYDFHPGDEGFYFLMYQVCYKDDINKDPSKVLDIHSRFKLEFHFSNVDMFGRTSYLSAGEMVLPYLFLLFSLIYACCLYVWCKNIINIKQGKPGLMDTGSPPALPVVSPLGRGAQLPAVTVYPIHYLMGLLLTLKTFALFFESIRYHYLRVTGDAVFWSAVYYTFAFLKGITLFTVILMIGSGWSFVKPFLSEREKKIIMGILVLQVINNIAIVVLTQETEGERAFDRWTAVLHLVDILCCCAVLLPIVWQVNQLEKNMEQNQHDDADQEELEEFFDEDDEDDHIPEDEFENGSTTNGSVFHNGRKSETKVSRGPPDARLAAKLKLFRSFYILVVAYIYITRIVVYLFSNALNYKQMWIQIFVVELVTLAFYVTVGILFRPMNENPYLHIRRRQDTKEGKGPEVELRKIDPSTKAVID